MCLAIPGRVVEIYESHGLLSGKVDFGGVIKEVCLAFLPDIQTGDYAIVHVGVAISRIDEDSARETLRLLEETGILEEELPRHANTMETFTHSPQSVASESENPNRIP
jgi:hydrogenase expression/formation protein HypC